MSPSYVLPVKLSFRRQRGAYQFQHFVTGYKVWADLSVHTFGSVTFNKLRLTIWKRKVGCNQNL